MNIKSIASYLYTQVVKNYKSTLFGAVAGVYLGMKDHTIHGIGTFIVCALWGMVQQDTIYPRLTQVPQTGKLPPDENLVTQGDKKIT